jgi:tripartite-type tricarboxylate transporter receptor subunit TctC
MICFRSHFFQLVGAAISVVAVWHVASAQTGPAQPVRIIVPCAVGSPPDLVARIFAKEMSEISGQQTYVENFTAGAEPIDMAVVNKLIADGRSVLFNLLHCD